MECPNCQTYMNDFYCPLCGYDAVEENKKGGEEDDKEKENN